MRLFLKQRNIKKLYTLTSPEQMETAYIKASKELKKKIQNIKHPEKVAVQVIEPIKVSKEPLPEGLVFFKISGDKYNVYRTILMLGEIAKAKGQSINFVY